MNPSTLREAFRYVKEHRVRVYLVRVLPNAAELWIATGKVGRIGQPARRFRLQNADDLPTLLDDVELTLRQSGWARVGA